jgi:hypothetical protein
MQLPIQTLSVVTLSRDSVFEFSSSNGHRYAVALFHHQGMVSVSDDEHTGVWLFKTRWSLRDVCTT